ncbi:MAG: hypothetical protein HYV63_29465 [Candidatus Schekmanbacteria bacterium]|nr:hypothetical protein [Candidatus Schekmanbacteria bacterium]
MTSRRPTTAINLFDLIEQHHGSRYRFCTETGIDPGHLSRVLAGQAELSIQTLQTLREHLHAAIVIHPEEDLAERLAERFGQRHERFVPKSAGPPGEAWSGGRRPRGSGWQSHWPPRCLPGPGAGSARTFVPAIARLRHSQPRGPAPSTTYRRHPGARSGDPVVSVPAPP